MIWNEKVQVQVVPYLKEEYKETVKALRIAEPADYELIVVRQNNVIRYSSNNAAIAQHEKQFQYVERVKGQAAFLSRVIIVSTNNEGASYFCEYVSGILKQQTEIRDEQISYIQGASKQPEGRFYIFIEEDINQELRERLDAIETKYEVIQYPQINNDEEGNPEEQYRLTKKHFEIHKYKRTIIGTFFVLSLLAFGLIYSTSKGHKPIMEVVHRIEYETIDDFSQYREEVSKSYKFEQLAGPMVAAWLTLKQVPQGWTFDGLYFENGEVVATIFNQGTGSIYAMEQFKTNNRNASFIQMDGYQGKYGFSIDPKGNEWREKSVDFHTLQMETFELFTRMGAKIQANGTKELDGYKAQEIGVTLPDMSIHMPIEINEYLKNRPIFIETLTLTQGKSESTVDMTVTIKIIGS